VRDVYVYKRGDDPACNQGPGARGICNLCVWRVDHALRLLGLSAGVSLQLTSMHNAAAGALDSGAPSG